MSVDVERLRTALARTRDALAAAALRSGRAADAVELVLAGKYVAPGDTPALVSAGARVVGENRLQDLEAKYAIAPDLIFDFIGHLQRRKVKRVLPLVRLIHSVDSIELAREIDTRAIEATTVLCEVNIGAEPTKSGILPAQIDTFVEAASALPKIVLGGLMTLPPAVADPQDSRAHFARLREMNERLAAEWAGRHQFQELSMGTSQDFLIAAEEGATKVRIGRSVIETSQVG